MGTQTPQSGPMSPADLLAENISLRKKISQQEQAIVNLVEKNNGLAEFIRVKMSDILALSKEFRDEYGRYAAFVQQMTQAAVQTIGDLDDNKKEKTPLQLDDDQP